MIARVARNCLAQLPVLLVTFFDRFVVVGVLLRSWGAATYAEWTILASAAGLLSLTECGLNVYYGNTMQKAWARRDAGAFQRALSVALAVAPALGFISALAAMVIVSTPGLLGALAPGAAALSNAGAVFLLLALAAASRVGRTAISQVWRGRNEFALGIVVDLLAPAALCACSVLAGAMGAGPLSVAALVLVVELAAGWGAYLLLLRRRYAELRFRPALPTAVELGEMARHGAWLAILQGGTLAWLHGPIILLGRLGLGGAPLVSFVLMRTLANFARTIAGMVSLGAGVEAAALLHAGEQDEPFRHAQWTGYALSLVTIVLAAGILTFGPSLIKLWTGQEGLFDRPAAAALLCGAIISAPFSPLGALVTYSGSTRPVALSLAGQFALGLGAAAGLASIWGIRGAAIGLTLGEGIAQVVLLPAFATKELGRRISATYLLRAAATIVLAALWLGLASGATALLFRTDNAQGLAAGALFWMAFASLPLAGAFAWRKASPGSPRAAA